MNVGQKNELQNGKFTINTIFNKFKGEIPKSRECEDFEVRPTRNAST